MSENKISLNEVEIKDPFNVDKIYYVSIPRTFKLGKAREWLKSNGLKGNNHIIRPDCRKFFQNEAKDNAVFTKKIIEDDIKIVYQE